MFGEWEETLSVNLRYLNESTNAVGIFVTDDWTLPIDSTKNTEERTPFRLGAQVWCRPKALGRENKYPCLKRAKNTFE